MSSGSGLSGAAAVATSESRAASRQPDQQKLAGALAVLDAHRRDKLLEAVAIAAKELLRSSDLAVSLPKVSELIGQVTGADRTHIFLIDGNDGQGQILQHSVWIRPGTATPPEFQHATEPLTNVGLQSWIPRLARGETIVGHVREFAPPVRAFFELGNVKSMLCVPIFAEGQWRGLIGFDDCRSERVWSAAEIDAIGTMAELVGAAVARTSHQKKLADANRIVENSSTILYRLSPREPYELIYLSQNIRQFGYDADKLLASPNNWLSLIAGEYHAKIAADIKSIVEGKTERTLAEFRLRKADGTSIWVEARAYAVRDEERRLTAIEGILTDITDRKLAAEKIATLARTDSLTDLPNRAAFIERLNLEFARAKRRGSQFAVHYIDLDHFKDVNDTLGHPAGDTLLRIIGERLKSCLRETDMVARFGGDEFAVLQDDVADTAKIETLAMKIGEVIAAPCAIGGNQVSTTASIGIVPYQADIASVDAIMMKADLALYRAKNEGRNQFSFHVAELDEQTRERMIIGDDLRHAVERGELELFYQPQVEIKSGWIVGLEALLRWNHPKRGLLLPAVFIPIAEMSGSIVPIGEWVIEQACRQIAAWSEAGIAPPVLAVNLSGAQIKLASQLDQIITDNLVRYNVRPQRLELELTESVLFETTQRHSEAFKRLRQIGVRFAIDDFGTGYSSLDYLRSFNVSRLKIDRSFIADVTTNPDDAAIVRATIGLAHELGIEVVAEGVETAEQKDFLGAAGCKLAQGFYFGEAAPAAAASEMLRKNLQFAAV